MNGNSIFLNTSSIKKADEDGKILYLNIIAEQFSCHI